MRRYAVIQDGIVVNVVEWDRTSAWSPPDGTQLVPDTDGAAEPGGRWNGARFLRVRSDPAPLPPTVNDLIRANLGEVERLQAALAVRVSTGWASLPAVSRERVQEVIDGVADRVRDLLTGG